MSVDVVVTRKSNTIRNFPCTVLQSPVVLTRLKASRTPVEVVVTRNSNTIRNSPCTVLQSPVVLTRLKASLVSTTMAILNLIIIIIIAFKGASPDFLQSPHSAANCLQHVRSSGPCAIVCKSRATHRALITCKCHVTCHLVRRDSSAITFDRVEIAFI